MAEFANNSLQLVAPNQNILLNTVIPCNKGYVIHRDGSGIVTLRGIVNNSCGCFARYQINFNGNIGIPSDGTAPAAIAVALAIDGEPIQTSRAIVTPAAVVAAAPSTSLENYFNVTSTAIITVPKGCCFNISVENDSPAATSADPAPSINVINANLTVARIA